MPYSQSPGGSSGDDRCSNDQGVGMDFLKEGWEQAGAIGVLFVGMAIVIWRLYVDGKTKERRNDEFGERVIIVAVESRKAIEADLELKRGLIDRIDRMIRP
jgi:hypothetical protein